jgi:hypothetical protein
MSGRVEVDAGYREPTNLGLIGIADVGVGKTPAFNAAVRPLLHFERQLQDEAAPKIREARTKKKTAKQRERRATEAAGKATNEAEYAKAVSEAQEAALAADLIVVPPQPRLYTTEPTPEGLARLLGEHDGRMAVLTDEAAEFFELASRYAKNATGNLGVYLAGRDGQPFRSDRAGRDPILLDRVLLTTVLMGQPIVLRQLGRDSQARGRGLLARYQWSVPLSHVGRRQRSREPVPRELVDGWRERVEKLANLLSGTPATAPVVVRLAVDAEALYDQWWAAHEPRLELYEGDLRDVRDWGNKLPGDVLRLAAVLVVLRHWDDGWEVDAATMDVALHYADYFVSHALVAFDRMGSAESFDDAKAVLRWIGTRRLSKVSTRDVAQSKNWLADRTRDALVVLSRYGWLRLETAPTRKGRPSEVWGVHPKCS